METLAYNHKEKQNMLHLIFPKIRLKKIELSVRSENPVCVFSMESSLYVLSLEQYQCSF